MSDDCDWKRDYALAASEMREIRERDEEMSNPKVDLQAAYDNAMRQTGWQPNGVTAASITLAWRMFELLCRINELPYTTLPSALRDEVAAICGNEGKSQ